MQKFLPKRFEESHSFAFYLHDALAHYVITGEKQNLFSTRFKIRDKNHINEIKGLSGEPFVTWLEQNGYKDVVVESFYRQIIVATLSDFCHFVYEGLKCSEKGKTTVAFALFRKPFKENLLFFEMLLGDPAKFMNYFYNKETSNYTIDEISPEDKIQIIADAINKVCPQEKYFDEDHIYKLRYDKKCDYGFEKYWHKATHLVTSYKEIKTEPYNLNFVFSSFEDKESQWEFIYLMLPMLLYYTLNVIEKLFLNIAKFGSFYQNFENLRRTMNFIIWSHEEVAKVDFGKEARFLIETLKDTLSFNCPKCSVKIIPDLDNIKRFIRLLEIKCPKCKEVIRITGLIEEDSD